MRLERLTNEAHPMYQQALELYRSSFPFHEQRESLSQNEVLNDAAYYFQLIYDQTRFVGLVLYWETNEFIYIEHFCILPELRNRSYGQQVLAFLCERKKTVILEIDPPIDDISIRRSGFYARCGFVRNSYSHIHPPYHRESAGHPLVVLSYPNQLTEHEYFSFADYLEHHIMKDAIL